MIELAIYFLVRFGTMPYRRLRFEHDGSTYGYLVGNPCEQELTHFTGLRFPG